MKRAFTLIELLVVIAIIAILAAILFPVFAQAKTSAKKAVSISNQKQIGLGLMMYSTDFDDLYPRQDGCTLNDSMLDQFNGRPAGTDPTPWCNNSENPGGYAFRDNHYSWQKWIQPYVKNKQLFFHPVIAPIYGTTLVDGAYENQGELESGYALNIAITGALNVWPTPAKYGAWRNSFLGGTVTAIPQPADAMVLMEQAYLAAAGGLEWPTDTQTVTYFPLAIREHWQGVFYTSGGNGPCGETTTIDSKAVPFNVVPLSYADGHTKAISVGQFLANTPTSAEYGFPFDAASCSIAMAYYFEPNQPTWTQSWPMWGLN
jgi:prepilin-type N-terminal cleavage/methylation domain-containing protein